VEWPFLLHHFFETCVTQKEKGRYAYGAPPYGWQVHKNEPTEEETEEETEQAGRTRARLLRDEDELSYREIAAVLDAEGIRPRRGERWQIDGSGVSSQRGWTRLRGQHHVLAPQVSVAGTGFEPATSGL
jgi:hypothetical protein